jgi:ATP-binding cassette subfamily F protein 3
MESVSRERVRIRGRDNTSLGADCSCCVDVLVSPGKSTLLRQISTYTLPKFPTWIKIMHVEQEVVASTSSVLEVVLAADLERTMLLKEEQELTNRLKQDGGEDVTAAAEKQEEESKEPPSPTSSTASGAPSVSSTATTVASASSTSSSSSSVTATSDRLTAVYDRLLELDSATAKARAGTILAGLQFTQEMTQMPTKALSGGWRSQREGATA